MHQLILFGLPGAGKSYVGQVLSEHFGYEFLEGDSQLTQEMILSLETKQMMSDDMRDEFMKRLVQAYLERTNAGKRIVLSQTFLQEKHRMLFHTTFPAAVFLLIEAPDPLREQRYLNRKQLSFPLSTLRANAAKFEPVGIPYLSIQNENEGQQYIIENLKVRGIQQL